MVLAYLVVKDLEEIHYNVSFLKMYLHNTCHFNLTVTWQFSSFIIVIYPFIHLSGETKISKMNILPQNASDEEPSKEWVDQGFYVELEHISSKTSFSFKELNYVIFIGVQSHQDSLSSRLGK